MRKFILYIFLISAIASCKSGPTDEEKMHEAVKSYYFLDDTVDVNLEVTDTLYLDQVQEMFTTVQKNLQLVQLDIDTLNTIIDDWSYKNLDSTATNAQTDSTKQKLKSTQFELKLTELKVKKDRYIQTRRILNHLRRDSWADIAGFNAEVTFHSGEMIIKDEILLSGEFKIVD